MLEGVGNIAALQLLLLDMCLKNGGSIMKQCKIYNPQKKMFAHLKVGMMMGKVNYIVPLLIPTQCITTMNILTVKPLTVKPDTPVMLLRIINLNSLQQEDHCFTCTDVMPLRKCLWQLELKTSLTTSKQRHHISTVYTSLGLPSIDKEDFYKHIGHCKVVNEGNYQRPLPILAVIEGGKTSQLES